MGATLVQRLAMAALVDVVPVSMVEDVLHRCERTGQRVRSLPPWVTCYHVLAAAMDPSAGYDEVTALLWATLPAATGRGLARQLPSRGAVTRARARLGVEPFEVLLGELLRAARGERNTSRVYLQKLHYGTAFGWLVRDAGTGALLGCELDPGAAPELVESVGATAVVLCPPHDGSSEELRQRLAATVTVAVGAMPVRHAVDSAPLRGRSAAAAKQEIMARACVLAAQEAASRRVRLSHVTG
ncbi:MAG: transposase domain-containing protein [Mycobacterium sp.]